MVLTFKTWGESTAYTCIVATTQYENEVCEQHNGIRWLVFELWSTNNFDTIIMEYVARRAVKTFSVILLDLQHIQPENILNIFSKLNIMNK